MVNRTLIFEYLTPTNDVNPQYEVRNGLIRLLASIEGNVIDAFTKPILDIINLPNFKFLTSRIQLVMTHNLGFITFYHWKIEIDYQTQTLALAILANAIRIALPRLISYLLPIIAFFIIPIAFQIIENQQKIQQISETNDLINAINQIPDPNVRNQLLQELPTILQKLQEQHNIFNQLQPIIYGIMGIMILYIIAQFFKK